MGNHRLGATRLGWIVAFATAVSAFAGAQQPPAKQASPERPESATADLRALYESLVDLKFGVKPPDRTAGTVASAGQDLSKTPRAAAVRYVREHGLDMPSEDVVVALDTTFQNIDANVQPFTQAELERDALEIARILGPKAQTGKAEAWLRCQQSRCVPSTPTHVLVVNQAEDATSGAKAVPMTLYLSRQYPTESCAARSIVVVDVEPRDGGWIGVRNRLGPAQLPLCLPK